MEQYGKNIRLAVIDEIKGLGILLVIFGHSGLPMPLYRVIYGFHMPLFFMISGYLYSEEKWGKLGAGKLIRKRAYDYLIPYFLFSFVNLILNGFIELRKFGLGTELFTSTIRHVFWIFYSYGSAERTPNCTPLWFLPCLFLAYIYFYGIVRLQKRVFIVVACLLCGIVDWFLFALDVPQLPWHLDSAFMGCIFMVCGCMMRKYDLINNIRPHIWIFIAITGIFCICLNGIVLGNEIDVNKNALGNAVLFWIGSVFTAGAFLSLCVRYLPESGILLLFGRNRNTVIVLAFNNFLNLITERLWLHLPFIKNYPYTWYIKICVVTGILVIFIFIFEFSMRQLHKTKKCFP